MINCFDFAYFCFFNLNNLNFYKKLEMSKVFPYHIRKIFTVFIDGYDNGKDKVYG